MPTQTSMVMPARRLMGRKTSVRLTARAPRLGMARNRPRPDGPACKTVMAKMGMRATAPPSSTAKRSSEMEPSRSLVCATYFEAGKHGFRVEGLLFPGLGTWSDSADERDEADEHGKGEDVDDGCAAPASEPDEGCCEEESAEHGADCIGGLVDARAPGDGVDEVLRGDEGGEHGAGGRDRRNIGRCR